MQGSRQPTETYIDSQTLGCVVIALEQGHPNLWTEWVTSSALISTCVLLTLDEVRISPPARQLSQKVRAYVGSPGNHGVLSESLATTIKGYAPDPLIIRDASKTVTTWAARNPEILRRKFEEFRDSKHYEPWLNYESGGGWKTATVVLNGIVDEKFLTSISRAASIEAKDAMRILLDSRNPKIVDDWCRDSYLGEDKEIAKIIFSMGALLRGRYHDRVAELSGSSIIHHPLRLGVLKPLPTGEAPTFRSSNTLEYIAKIVLAASLSEMTPAARIKTWAENISILRENIVYKKSINVPDEDISDNTALEIAIRAVQDCKIRAHPKFLDGIIHHSIALGLGAATSFLLNPWMFPISVVGSELVASKIERGFVAGSVARSSFRLNRLAKSMPGRLQRA